MTVVPLIALQAKTAYHPWDKNLLRINSSITKSEKTSLFGVDWSPDGSYALAVGDQATVVKFTPESTTCPPGYVLEMPIQWREQLDALRLHRIESYWVDDILQHTIDEQSRLNRFDAIKWRPNSNTAFIAGGAWLKYSDFQSNNLEELAPSKQIKMPGNFSSFSLVGGGCILTFDQTTFRLVNQQPYPIYDAVELRGPMTPDGQPSNMHKFWNIGWRPDGDLAVVLGEAPGKVLVCKPVAPDNYTLNEITELLRNPNVTPPEEPADLYTVLWNPTQNHFLMAGDAKHVGYFYDDNGVLINTIKYETNWMVKFVGDMVQPLEQFENTARDSITEMIWNPEGSSAFALGSHIYKATVNNAGILEIPTTPMYDNTLGTIKYNQGGEENSIFIRGVLEGICWHSSRKYAIITGGMAADTIQSEKKAWQNMGASPQAIPKINPYNQLFIYDTDSSQLFKVRFPLKNSPPLLRARWRPSSGGEPFAVTVIRYRQ